MSLCLNDSVVIVPAVAYLVPRWVMKIDLHVHSKYSFDSQSEPEEIIDHALRCGLDGILITEHNSFEVSEPWEQYARDAKRNKGLLILRAVEISTSSDHVIAVGFDDDSWNPWRDSSQPRSLSGDEINMYELLIKLHAMGGASIVTHPCRFQRPFRMLEDFEKAKHFTTVEGINGLCSAEDNYRTIEQMRKWNRSYTGGSDAHTPIQVGRAFTEFAHPVFDTTSLIQELKAGDFVGKYGQQQAANVIRDRA